LQTAGTVESLLHVECCVIRNSVLLIAVSSVTFCLVKKQRKFCFLFETWSHCGVAEDSGILGCDTMSLDM